MISYLVGSLVGAKDAFAAQKITKQAEDQLAIKSEEKVVLKDLLAEELSDKQRYLGKLKEENEK